MICELFSKFDIDKFFMLFIIFIFRDLSKLMLTSSVIDVDKFCKFKFLFYFIIFYQFQWLWVKDKVISVINLYKF